MDHSFVIKGNICQTVTPRELDLHEHAYAVCVDGVSYIGVTNVGVRPTVEDSDRVNCETHILDFNGSLYGRAITTEFYTKLRDEKRFGGLAELMEAIRADAAAARAYFAGVEGARV